MTEQLHFGPSGVTGNGITANAQELNRNYAPQPPLPARGPSLLAQVRNSLTGALDERDYEVELQMPFPQMPQTAPTWVDVGNDESVLIDAVQVAALAANSGHPIGEPIMEEDFSQDEIFDFAQRLNEFGRERFLQGTQDAQGGLVTNSVSEVMTFINSEGGMTHVEQLVRALTPEIWAEVTRPKPLPTTPERWALIESIVTHSAGRPEAWSEDELTPVTTDALKKLYVHYLPKDYSGNGGVIRQSGPENEELTVNWGDFGKVTGNGPASSWESPNNILRRLSRESQNGNGIHHG